MKSTGIVRKLDDLGRVVMPIELRRSLGINERDSLEIFVDGENIIFHKYAPACTFCDTTDDVREFKGKNICGQCQREIAQMEMEEEAEKK